MEWTHPGHATLYAPGIFAPASQSEKYCAQVKNSDGSWMASKHGNAIINPHFCTSITFPEIVTPGQLSINQGLLLQITAHLIKTIIEKNDQRFAATLSKKLYRQKNSYAIDLHAVNIGQSIDVSCVSYAYDQLCNDATMPNAIVLYGFSRGAAAAFNFIATEYEHKPIKRIKAIVLEACFDSVQALNPILALILEQLLPHFSRRGLSPIHTTNLLAFVRTCTAYNIPVLLVSSKKDCTVAYANSLRLFKKLSQAGLYNLSFLTLHHSGHAGYLFDHPQDRTHYHYGIHAFYKKSNVAYIPELAEQGATLLQTYRFPTLS